jgi:predicted dehydrogenase
MKPIRVAVIGCGTIAEKQHVRHYARHPQAELRYLVDVRPERAQALAETYRVPFVETDYRNILRDEELDAVSICTPNHTHAEIAVACLEAGKHVLCEKPAAVSWEQTLRMKEAADRSGKILNIGVVNRYHTAVHYIKQMIEAGELGDVYHVYCSFRAHRAIPGLGGPFTTKALSGGGVLIDWGVHFLDLVLYCLGQPKVRTVSGAAHSRLGKDVKEYAYVDMWAGPPNYNGVYDVEDFVTGFIRTDGATITFNGAWAQNIGQSDMSVEFLGDKAGVKLQYGGGFKVYAARDGMLLETTPTFRQGDMFYDEIDDFLHSVRTGVRGRTHIDQVLPTARVLDAVYASAERGEEIAL